MLEDLKKKLTEKGWTTKEIEHTMDILERPDTDIRSKEYRRRMNPLIYWIALLVAIIGNFIVSVILIPFLLVLQGVILYSIIILLGIVFGALFSLLLRDIERASAQKNMVIGWIFIPAIAAINIYVVANISNELKEILIKSAIIQNPLTISITYVAAFILPYVAAQIYLSMKNKKEAKNA